MSIPGQTALQRQLAQAQLQAQINFLFGGLNGGHRQASQTISGHPSQAGYPGYTFQGATAAQIAALYAIRPPSSVFAAYDAPPEPIEDAGIRAGEVTAWRCWRVEDGFLGSVLMKNLWAPDEPMEGKLSEAGVHAWKKLGKALEYGMNSSAAGYVYPPVVIGQVELWGDIVEHEHGYRAENAAIVSLDGILGGSQRQLDAVRKVYGVGGRGGLVVEWPDEEEDYDLEEAMRARRMVVSGAGAVRFIESAKSEPISAFAVVGLGCVALLAFGVGITILVG